MELVAYRFTYYSALTYRGVWSLVFLSLKTKHQSKKGKVRVSEVRRKQIKRLRREEMKREIFQHNFVGILRFPTVPNVVPELHRFAVFHTVEIQIN